MDPLYVFLNNIFMLKAQGIILSESEYIYYMTTLDLMSEVNRLKTMDLRTQREILENGKPSEDADTKDEDKGKDSV